MVHWYGPVSPDFTTLTYTAWRTAPVRRSSRTTVHPVLEGWIVASALVAMAATSTSPAAVEDGCDSEMLARPTEDPSDMEPTRPIPLPDGGGGGGGRVGAVPGA